MLPELAAAHRVPLMIHAVHEVFALHANAATLPALQFAFVYEIPFLHVAL